MGTTSIEWTRGDDGLLGKTWNPIRGCSPVSPGCKNCYAEMIAARFSGPGQPFEGFATWRLKSGQRIHPADTNLWTPGEREPSWTGKMALLPQKLAEPLRWRSPARVFVNSMSDLFHEGLTFSEIATVFAVMAVGRHTYQILTKRIERAREFLAWMQEKDPIGVLGDLYGLHVSPYRGPDEQYDDHRYKCDDDLEAIYEAEWPLENVWLGASVENQKFAEQRVPELLQCPAAKRFISYEPALGPVNLDLPRCDSCGAAADSVASDGATPWCSEHDQECSYGHWLDPLNGGLDWVIVGGESGPGARLFDIAWARTTVTACRAAGVPVFVKQLGKHAIGEDLFHEHQEDPLHEGMKVSVACAEMHLKNAKGNDPTEWPEDLRVREFPT